MNEETKRRPGRPSTKMADPEAAARRTQRQPTDDDLLTSQVEVAEDLGMSTDTLERWLTKYPWDKAELPNGKPGGRWRVTRGDVRRWWAYVRRQETRHPSARIHYPEEPPALSRVQHQEAVVDETRGGDE